MNRDSILTFLKQWGFTLLIFLLLIGASVYGYVRITSLNQNIALLSNRVNSLETTLDTTAKTLEGSIKETHTSLSKELSQEKQKSSAIEEKLGGVEQEVGSISGTVGTLEKLSKTDPELLQKYSKVFFLNEHYAPERLVEIPVDYTYSNTRAEKIHASISPRLLGVMNAAKAQNITLYIKSAYRSFEEQKSLKSVYSVTYGSGTANQFSADQGYSEHQLGTTVDFITTGLGGELAGFETTGAYQWLLNNAYKYGFVLSYPQNNSYYVFEPWHWRYVGVELAAYLKNQNKNFYDLDQRDIDAYLVKIFD